MIMATAKNPSTGGTTKKVAAKHPAKAVSATPATKAKGVPSKAGKAKMSASAKLDLSGAMDYATNKTVKAVVRKGVKGKKGMGC